MSLPIYIQSNAKEIESGRLLLFLSKYKTYFRNNDVTLFLDAKSKQGLTSELVKIFLEINLEVMYVDVSDVNNEITKIFFEIMLNNITEHPVILLLETDVHINFKNINKLYSDYNKFNGVWIYGSHYDGLNNGWINRNHEYRSKHMNGVAIYNRCVEFIDFDFGPAIRP